MLKVLKNLKESWYLVLIIIILLCIQAATDLKLPDFTSQIVNVGIQQGGIENTAPNVIRKSTLDQLMYFTDKDSEILNDYKLLEKNQENIEKYPVIKDEDVYELKDISKEEFDALQSYMEKPLMVLNFMNSEEFQAQMKMY